MATIVPRKNKSGTSYRAQVRIYRNGTTVYSESKTFSKKKQAEVWSARREMELEEPGAIDRLTHGGVTVGRVLEIYESEFNTENNPFGRTKLDAVKALQKMDVANLNALTLTTQQLIKHIQRRVLTVDGSTAQNDLVWLRAAFKSIRQTHGMPVDEGVINDASDILRREKVVHSSSQRDRRPSIGELDSLMDHFHGREGRQAIPMDEVILFAMFSSRRQSEICEIMWDDLDERRQSVLVRQMKHPRKKIDTWVYLPDEAWAVIQRQLRLDGEPRIFPFNGKSISAAFTRACKLLAIKDLRFHDLRHECASWSFETGLDVVRVARITGHKSWESLRRYTHLQDQNSFDKYEGWRWRPKLPKPKSEGEA